MDAMDAVNAALAAQQYQENVAKSRGILRLRSGKTFAELAEQAVHVLWNDLLIRSEKTPMDPHRFEDLAKAIQRVLTRGIDACATSADPALWDAWAKTGGGNPTEAQTPPICAQHSVRLQTEFRGELDRVLLELEQAAGGFMKTRAQTALHASIEGALRPFLIKNLATRYCEDCEREFRNQTVTRRNTP